jgi:hypothetical protein
VVFSFELIFIGEYIMQTLHSMMTTDSFALASPRQEVGELELNKLLGGRIFTGKHDSEAIPSQVDCDPDDLQELEEYCQKRNIIGVGFPGMSPSSVLRILKAKHEGASTLSIKKGLLHD